jgi:hypothetical protein
MIKFHIHKDFSRARNIVSHQGYFDVEKGISYAIAKSMKYNTYCK